MNTKKCRKCKIEKPLTEFSKRKALKDGLQYKCKACQSQSSANWRGIPKNKEKQAQYNANWYAIPKNKEKIAQYHAERKAEQPNCTYRIKNLVNNKVYIGETTRGELRWKDHLRYLGGNRHENKPLQEDFNKHGEEAFEWSILKEFESEDKDALLLEEARTIQQYIQDGVELYNVQLTNKQLEMLTEGK